MFGCIEEKVFAAFATVCITKRENNHKEAVNVIFLAVGESPERLVTLDSRRGDVVAESGEACDRLHALTIEALLIILLVASDADGLDLGPFGNRYRRHLGSQ